MVDGIKTLSIKDFFEIGESDTVWDAWFMTVTLVDFVEQSQQLGHYYDLQQTRNKIDKIHAISKAHAIDITETKCSCRLTDGEHALLKRKIIRFYKLQVVNLKHFI